MRAEDEMAEWQKTRSYKVFQFLFWANRSPLFWGVLGAIIFEEQWYLITGGLFVP